MSNEIYDRFCRDHFDSIDGKLNTLLERQSAVRESLAVERTWAKGKVFAGALVVTATFAWLAWLNSEVTQLVKIQSAQSEALRIIQQDSAGTRGK